MSNRILETILNIWDTIIFLQKLVDLQRSNQVRINNKGYDSFFLMCKEKHHRCHPGKLKELVIV